MATKGTPLISGPLGEERTTLLQDQGDETDLAYVNYGRRNVWLFSRCLLCVMIHTLFYYYVHCPP